MQIDQQQEAAALDNGPVQAYGGSVPNSNQFRNQLINQAENQFMEEERNFARENAPMDQ